ncbi:hypothetical protein [Echinicola strongylocentroti]|nr:hypothetical protein [Echinicola strongylocentroti]
MSNHTNLAGQPVICLLLSFPGKLSTVVSVSTLSDANINRSSEVFASIYLELNRSIPSFQAFL